MHPLEWILAYLSPLVYLYSQFSDVFCWGALAQLALFVPVVSLPALIKSRMSYVDIGWPCGLCLMAGFFMFHGTGFWVRKYTACGTMLLHGSRMALGALFQFFPYNFPQDLPR